MALDAARNRADEEGGGEAEAGERPKGRRGGGGGRKEKPGKAAVEQQAIQALSSALTVEELEDAIKAADGVRKASPALLKAIEKACDRLARL